MLLSKPVRSALFVPATRPDRIPKALATDADAVIIDLEDAVPPNAKTDARSELVRFLAVSDHNNVIVRVNGIGTEYFQEDISAVAGASIMAVIVPKVESAEDVALINTTLSLAEKTRESGNEAIPLIPLIESATGVENIAEIVRAETEPTRLCTVAFGAADYTLDLGIDMTPGGNELLYARSRLPVSCRAAGLAPPIDTPFMIDLKDLDGLRTDAVRAKQLGFQGKLCIHPNQVEIVNQVFSPTPEEIEWAREVVRAFEEAQSAGQGALQINGKFIDAPVVSQARRVLSFFL